MRFAKPDLRWLEDAAKLDPMVGRVAAVVDEWVCDPSVPTVGIGIMPKTGKFVCIYSDKASTWPLETIRSVFQHELTHVSCGHQSRFEPLLKEGIPCELANIAADAVVHEVGQINLDNLRKIVTEQGPLEPVTFALLQLPPNTMENTVRALMNNESPSCKVHHMEGQGHCGRTEALAKHGLGDSKEAKYKAQSILTGAGVKGGTHSGQRSPISDLPAPPAWTSEVMQYLRAKRKRVPARSWRRGPTSRLDTDVIPGRPRVPRDLSATIMLDASGSMGEDQVRQAIGAVRSAGFQAVKIRVFSDHISEELAPQQVGAEVSKHGGGTLINMAAEVVAADQHVIWLTDAESGDGLPAKREGWIWVVYSANEYKVTEHPSA